MATQSAHISSSQGFADGSPSDHNSAKDSKFSVTMGSQAPGIAVEGVGHNMKDTEQNMELHRGHSAFSGCTDPVSSVHDSFGVNSSTGPLKQNASPVKISPVSERIKALEALASKQTSDTWSDGGFLLFKERHYEKSPTETFSPFQKREISPDHDSPESPFEVLGDPRRGNDFEDTADWMRAHLPPAPHFETVPDLDSKAASDFLVSEVCESQEMQTGTAIVASVPDAFMDIPGTVLHHKDKASEQVIRAGVDEESEFDMSYLPTAYMWDKHEKVDQERQGATKAPEFKESKLPPSPPPPAGFGSPTPPPSPPAVQLEASEVTSASWSSELEPAEIVDVDSSGESDDTVIEDAVSVQIPVPSYPVSFAPSSLQEDKEMQIIKQEKQPILVPVINVIETDEQVLSDDEEVEEEGFQVVTDLAEEQSSKSKCEQGKSEQHADLVTENTLGLCEEDASGVPSLADFTVEVSLQNDAKHDCQAKNASSHSHDLLNKETESCPVSEHCGDLDSLEAQSLTTETIHTENKPFDKSSHYTVSSDMIMEQSPDLLNHDQDILEQVPSTLFDSGTDAGIDTAVHISLGFTHSLKEETEVDAIQGTLTEQVDLLQEDMNTSVPQSEREAAGDGFLLDTELSLDSKTSVVSYDSGLQNQAADTLMGVHKNGDIRDSEIMTASRDDHKVAAEDWISKPVGVQLSPQDMSQYAFSDFQDNIQDDNCEMAKCEAEKDYSSDVANSCDLQQQHEFMMGQDVGDVPNQESELLCSAVGEKQDSYTSESSTEVPHDSGSMLLECPITVPADSFVEFMRECLKSRQDEEPVNKVCIIAGKELCETGEAASCSQPTMVLDVEQERLTICALQELGSSQEDEEDPPFLTKRLQATKDKEEDVPLLIANLQTKITPMPPPSASTGEPPAQAEEVEGIDTWVADAYHLAEHVLAAILTHFSVKDLVYWRDPKKTAVVFGVSLLMLLSLAAFSVISVVSYLLLALLCVTISFRMYKSVIQAVQKSSEGHPFKALMEKDVSVPPETFRKHVDICLSYINHALKHLSRLFLVEDLVDSIKLAVVMWLLTYVGAVFNGITILILADILLFTIPLAYEKNKTQIDNYMGIARTQFNTIAKKLQETIPGAKRKAE